MHEPPMAVFSAQHPITIGAAQDALAHPIQPTSLSSRKAPRKKDQGRRELQLQQVASGPPTPDGHTRLSSPRPCISPAQDGAPRHSRARSRASHGVPRAPERVRARADFQIRVSRSAVSVRRDGVQADTLEVTVSRALEVCVEGFAATSGEGVVLGGGVPRRRGEHLRLPGARDVDRVGWWRSGAV